MKTIVLPIEKEFRAPLCVFPACMDEVDFPLFFCQTHQFHMDGAEAAREKGYGSNDSA